MKEIIEVEKEFSEELLCSSSIIILDKERDY